MGEAELERTVVTSDASGSATKVALSDPLKMAEASEAESMTRSTT